MHRVAARLLITLAAIVVLLAASLFLSPHLPVTVFIQTKARVSEGLSHLLQFTTRYEPATSDREARFVTTLTNATRQTLTVCVNDKEFHAKFRVTTSDGNVLQIYDRKYFGMVMTSTWSEPPVSLAAQKSLTWTSPLSTLIWFEREAPVTPESLQQTSVSAEMNLHIVPMFGGFREGNADQHSPPVSIP